MQPCKQPQRVVTAALDIEKQTGAPAAALELPDGEIIDGKTSDLLGASSALLLNALKKLAGIEHAHHVISPGAIRPIQELKTKYLGTKIPVCTQTRPLLPFLSALQAIRKPGWLWSSFPN